MGFSQEAPVLRRPPEYRTEGLDWAGHGERIDWFPEKWT